MADPNDPSEEITLVGLAQDVSSLQDFVSQQDRRDDLQQKAFDHLYEELKQYKDNFIYQMEKPLLLDLLLFYDSLTWFQQSLHKQEMSADVVADSFQYLMDEFLELLYRRDVLPTETSPRFNRESQKAIKVAFTDDPAKDYAVQRVVKRGFKRGEQLLRPEEVVLHRFRQGGGSDNGKR